MLVIVGLVIVTVGVVGGYLLAGGDLLVLNQPSEFVTIGGAAIGSMLASTPIPVLKATVVQIKSLLGLARRSGIQRPARDALPDFKQVSSRGDVARTALREPVAEQLLTKYPKFMARHEALDFLADSVKVIIVGGIAAHDLEALMDEDMKRTMRSASSGGGADQDRRRAARLGIVRPFSASSSPWATSTRRRRKSAITSERR